MSTRSRKRGSNRSANPRPNRRRRNKPGRPQRTDPAAFWGDASTLPEASRDVRITDDPSAIARSLGPPPLPGQEVIAQHYFAAVYDRSVALAGALAAAGNLIRAEDLLEDH